MLSFHADVRDGAGDRPAELQPFQLRHRMRPPGSSISMSICGMSLKSFRNTFRVSASSPSRLCGRCLKMTATRRERGHRHLLLPPAEPPAAGCVPLARPLAAVEHLDLVEGVPGHVHVHAPLARALHDRFHLARG